MKISLSLLAFVAILILSGCADEDQKPNIVFIFIDDMGWKDVGFMGSTYYETPNIDRLANGGMIFTSAYANAANCAPTRACLLSGQYSPRHGLYTVAGSDRGKPEDRRIIPIKNTTEIPLDKITIAEALKPAGYVSAAIGKWHIGHTPKDQGFDVGIDRGDLGYPYGHYNEDSTYLTDHLTDVAVGFIRKNNPKETGKPFFLYLSHHAVHTPIQAKEEIIKKYKNKEGHGCHEHTTYAAMVESVDESVRDVNMALEEMGLSDNTLVIFFSDNGGHGTFTCQKPLRGGKGMYYEGGIREPMFAYWPGKIKAGSTNDIPVISTDFYPTFLDLAGQAAPEDYPLDGESIVPLISGEASVDRESLFWHFPAYLEAYAGLKEDSRDPIFRTRPVSVIRKGDWKLLLFYEEWMLDGGRDQITTNNAVELYNLSNDIGETNNLSNQEVEKRDELLDDLLAWIDETGAPVPTEANGEYVP
ncbi:MAG: sulfatase [Cyclobacteriaceae bacterium]